MDDQMTNLYIDERLLSASKQLEEIFTSLRYGNELAVEEIFCDILPVVKEYAQTPKVYQLLYNIHASDDYFARHTLCVGILSNMIGRWLQLDDGEIEWLTLGALLHDIGNTRIDPFILTKPGRLTKEEYEEIKLHTVYGYELLRKIDVLSDRVALIALQHHEREDGRGYPKGLMSNQIDLFAKIVAIADLFHAMLSSRVYQKQEAPFSIVMKQIQDESFGRIEPNIAFTVINKIMDSIVGLEVRLLDGRTAKVVLIHSAEPLYPLLELDGEFIDTRENRQIVIDKILNHV